MRLNYILSAISIALIGYGLMVFLPVFVALFCNEYSSVLPFVISGFLTIGTGLICKFLAGKRQNFNDLRKKRGVTFSSFMLDSYSIFYSYTIPIFWYEPNKCFI